MDIIEEAFNLLYPNRQFKYRTSLVYSGRFSDYNANARRVNDFMEFRLCRKWRNVSKEIKIGLIQELMLGLLNDKKDSMYIDLYNGFVKRLHLVTPKTKTHPMLEDSFNRVNEKYFYGIIEQPNLEWGAASKAKLGSYNFKNDTISISKIFIRLEPVLLDFVMYHEMLHKKHKYKNKGGRNSFHDSGFRKKEKEFEDHDEVDRLLKKRLRNVRIKSFFGF
jgi:hypothetical protein